MASCYCQLRTLSSVTKTNGASATMTRVPAGSATRETASTFRAWRREARRPVAERRRRNVGMPWKDDKAKTVFLRMGLHPGD